MIKDVVIGPVEAAAYMANNGGNRPLSKPLVDRKSVV